MNFARDRREAMSLVSFDEKLEEGNGRTKVRKMMSREGGQLRESPSLFFSTI